MRLQIEICIGWKGAFRAMALTVIRGVVFFILMNITAITSFYLLAPWIITMILPFPIIYRIRRMYIYCINYMYFCFAATLLVYISHTKIYLHIRDLELLSSRNILILSNHRTRVDWMYSGWCYMAYMGLFGQGDGGLSSATSTCGTLYSCLQCLSENVFVANYPLVHFILKDALKYIPFFGWCMQCLVYIFLSRDRDKDLPHISRCLSYLYSINSAVNERSRSGSRPRSRTGSGSKTGSKTGSRTWSGSSSSIEPIKEQQSGAVYSP